MTEKNLAQDKQRTVILSADLVDKLDAYAAAEGISADLAARQFIRDGLEAASLPMSGLPILKGKTRKILEYVAKSGKRGINAETLVEMVYDDDRDGGPLYAIESLRVLICRVNKHHLKPAGYQIKGEHSGYGAFGNYRLVRREVAA